MLLNGGLAQKIIEEVQKLMNEHVIVTDTKGIIVASTDPNRIGAFHEGALLAINMQKTIHMDEEKVKNLQGVRYGIVLPLSIRGKAIGGVGITGQPEVVAPYAELLKKVTELFIQDNSYREEQERREREFELFVFDWLYQKQTEQALMQRGNFYGIDISNFQQLMVFKSLHHPFQFSYSDISLIRKSCGFDERTLLVRWGMEKLLIFVPKDVQSMSPHEAETIRKVIAGYSNGEIVGGVGQSLDSSYIHLSFQQAERACVVAEKRMGMIFEKDLQFDIIQYSLGDETKKEFIRRTIYPIENDSILIHTLEKWFEYNLSNKETAQALHIHINTLNYRLNKIAELTSFNLKNTHQLVMLYLAFRFLCENTEKTEKTVNLL